MLPALCLPPSSCDVFSDLLDPNPEHHAAPSRSLRRRLLFRRATAKSRPEEGRDEDGSKHSPHLLFCKFCICIFNSFSREMPIISLTYAKHQWSSYRQSPRVTPISISTPAKNKCILQSQTRPGLGWHGQPSLAWPNLTRSGQAKPG